MAIMVLKLDYTRMYQDLVDMVLKLSDELINEFHSEATSGIDGETEIDSPQFAKDFITAKVTFYADAIMQSYGTGSLMDRKNPYLAEYINSDKWNPERFTYTIVGRESGTYENIYGEEVQTSGKMSGKSVEKKYKPIQPSYSIQRAEQWFLKEDGKIKRRLNVEMQIFISGISKYFYNEFI